MKRFKNLAVTIAMLLVCAVQAYAESVTFEDWTSTNQANNSTSSMTYTFYVDVVSSLRFDWSVSSESGCDKLIVTLDGTQILERSGEGNGTYINESLEAGEHLLIVKYTKDGSVNRGSDCATVSNVEVFEKEFISQGGLDYVVSSSSTVCVLGGSNIFGNVVIPSTIKNSDKEYSVATINDAAFIIRETLRFADYTSDDFQ